MLKKLSIKWKMTILSAVVIFLIFMICNIIQLILIQTQTFKQEEQSLLKRSEEIQAFLNEQSKLLNDEGKQMVISEVFLENIVESSEMIRILDKSGNELFSISNDFPDIENSTIIDSGFSRIQANGERALLYKKPLNVGSFHGIIEIGRDVEMFETFLQQVIWTLLFGISTFIAIKSYQWSNTSREIIITSTSTYEHDEEN